jgi:hypothetical protein
MCIEIKMPHSYWDDYSPVVTRVATRNNNVNNVRAPPSVIAMRQQAGRHNTSSVGVPRFQQPSITRMNVENDWLRSGLKKLTPIQRVLNVSIKIHYFDSNTVDQHRVYVGMQSGKKYLVDSNNKKINCSRNIFIVSTSGRMYLTPDRTCPDYTIYEDGAVACHISFGCTDLMGADQVLFAGLITCSNGIPKVLSNETGTYMTDIVQTVEAKKVMETIFNNQSIELDLVMLPDRCIEDIESVLRCGDFSLVSRIVENLMQQQSRDLAMQIDAKLQEYRGLAQNSVDQSNECVICKDSRKDTLFLPCRHMVACGQCSRTLTECPVCRNTIDQNITAFM